jgi:hypothetical protein
MCDCWLHIAENKNSGFFQQGCHSLPFCCPFLQRDLNSLCLLEGNQLVCLLIVCGMCTSFSISPFPCCWCVGFFQFFSSPYGRHTDLFLRKVDNARRTDRSNFLSSPRIFKNKASTSIQHRGGGPFRVCFLISESLNQLVKLQHCYPSISHQSWGYSQGPQKTYHC